MENINNNEEQKLVADPEIEALKKRIVKLESVIKILEKRDNEIVEKLKSFASLISLNNPNSSDSNFTRLKENDERLLNAMKSLNNIILSYIS
jgi:hypothetical protein